MSKVRVHNGKGGFLSVLGPKIKKIDQMSYPHDFQLLYVWNYLAAPIAGIPAVVAADVQKKVVAVLIAECSQREAAPRMARG